MVELQEKLLKVKYRSGRLKNTIFTYIKDDVLFRQLDIIENTRNGELYIVVRSQNFPLETLLELSIVPYTREVEKSGGICDLKVGDELKYIESLMGDYELDY